MKLRKIKKSAALLLISVVALTMISGIATAGTLEGVPGETQSMIVIGCALAMGIAGVGSALGLMLAGSSAVAVTGEKPELFGRCLVFLLVFLCR